MIKADDKLKTVFGGSTFCFSRSPSSINTSSTHQENAEVVPLQLRFTATGTSCRPSRRSIL